MKYRRLRLRPLRSRPTRDVSSFASMAVLAMAGLGGCSGQMPGGHAGEGGEEGEEQPGKPGEVLAPPGACVSPADALPATRAWRLSPRQYANTLRATFGFEAALDGLPPDVPGGEGWAVFSTGSDGKAVSLEHFRVYQSNAQRLAERLQGEALRAHACLAQADDGCVEAFVHDYGARAFRRPVTDEELGRHVARFRDNRTRWGAEVATRLALEAMLLSPAHLYRTELGEPREAAGATVRLTHHEIAAQLSYGLVDGPPDAELMELAQQGRLHDPAEVRAQAERLLAVPAAQEKLTGFVSEWLRIHDLKTGAVSKDTTVFPAYTPALRDAMVRETETFVARVLFGGEGDLRTLFSANFSYVDRHVGALYGVSAGNEPARVILPPARSGILSQPSFLTATTPSDHSSPATRGIALYNRLLCEVVPAAPPGAADSAAGKVFSPEPGLTQREHWDYARANARECVGCHGQFVPMGLGLEQFDAIGRHRPEEYGKRIDPRVTIEGMGDELDGDYPDALAFGRRVIESETGRACVAAQFLSFATGRAVDSGREACDLRALGDRLRERDYDLGTLAVELTQLASFYNRRTGE